MERGLLVELSPNEETALQRIAQGVMLTMDMEARYLARPRASPGSCRGGSGADECAVRRVRRSDVGSAWVSLLKKPSGDGIGLPMKAMVDDCGLSNRALVLL
jgi:hypothetical protein